MADSEDNPARLVEHDPAWRHRAAHLLDKIREAFDGLTGANEAKFDHIGSTSVPGLAAKPWLDLQVRLEPLPTDAELAPRLAPMGFEREHGARSDSPGVNYDVPRADRSVPEEVWSKTLYVAQAQSAILHVRRIGSPWGDYTVWFRDWLRAHPEARRRYERTKRQASEQNVGKPDYDDYTQAKAAFFDEVLAEFTAWAQRNIGVPDVQI